MSDPVLYPAWKQAVQDIRDQGLTYGKSWSADELGKMVREKPGTKEFVFAVMNLRAVIEAEDGYYIQSEQDGRLYTVVEAAGHEDVAQGFDRKLRRYAVRSINLRSATLMNPDAVLEAADRARMEKNLEHAAVRLALISRAKSVVTALGKRAPKVLGRGEA